MRGELSLLQTQADRFIASGPARSGAGEEALACSWHGTHGDTEMTARNGGAGGGGTVGGGQQLVLEPWVRPRRNFWPL